jgi:hypothetical protein
VITADQANLYLDQALGVTVPGFFLSAAVERVATAEPAMIAAGYTAEQQTLVQCMAVAIIACAGAARRIASQGAPSGASRSFTNDMKALTLLRRTLAATDTAGTVAHLIGPDPSAGTLFFVTN